ncbi:Protein of unknown function DUF262 [Chitinophaga terrae (ex Kim and Jung 2007)]|uniref:GmrSD restriction endonucleases N-terminal domain-containing protein n=1 Tax=Chitinophaga terrae (ex Kim and Jung 2007) TaxID=408074 RepID=A0A1H4FKV5_9BACT|nr:DUF262 domain-containing protein [Chitinophaga terrae (ex Kim and Jung 2007)]GEP89015.1 hypothetical protein CTE07_06600 [Chitinophaga terrae (ex Kim and Jung 2007)]SEA97915.1 Protein of unknown function DUF262 [Chitinophaga terrae (ex Kim and Jung 2007)]
MSYIPKTISEVVTEYLNNNTFLPAIQREYVWNTPAIEKLFDSIMGDYPISTFLFWKIREENKNQWTAYEFIRDFDGEKPHNKEANLAGVNQDIILVLDGQQRLTSLFIGLKGSYRFFYYKWHKTRLYFNLLTPEVEPENPEELTYDFKFRTDKLPDPRNPKPQYWYLVGDILNHVDAEDAKKSIKGDLANFTEEQRDTANTHIGRLHSRIHTLRLLNYYEEKSQSYNKVVEAFIRANTGGVKLGYSDILLSTATAKWNTLNAREEIHEFTDDINKIGNGYSFEKDFVLKGCLYLTDNLPIQYKVENFTRTNLEKIENNWEVTKSSIEKAIKLVSKFGFNDKNLVSKGALLPIALYIQLLNKRNFVESTASADVLNQLSIQRWLTVALLKNAFGGSSDRTLKLVQDVIKGQQGLTKFPFDEINKRLNIDASFNEIEIEQLLSVSYSTKYSYLLLSLLYPNRDWKDNKYHEDHIYPKSEFTTAKLKQRGYDEATIKEYQRHYNTLANLQLLTDKENIEKKAADFDKWIASRDENFKIRHTIPDLSSYNFDSFLEFINHRSGLIKGMLKQIVMEMDTVEEVA